MGLREYQRKRDFRKTAEPPGAKSGRRRQAAEAGRSFVVQKHDASHLHYDFRLELDGVLKSWAVPKGPSLDPGTSRLAVEVEDHPLEYGGFEGTIPKGEYGGGTVMVWDRGTWKPLDDDPGAALRAGKIKFVLRGKRLRGEWLLVRTRREASKPQWILRKADDEHARRGKAGEVTASHSTSVASGREMEEIAAAEGKVWSSKAGGASAKSPRKRPAKRSTKKELVASPRERARIGRAGLGGGLPGAVKGAMPQAGAFKPQLAVLVDHAPRGDAWVHEIKFDGYRTLAHVRGGKIRLITRGGKDWTARYAEIASELEAMDLPDCILDGEVVVLNRRGVSDFQALQRAMKEGEPARLHYYVFDVGYFDGHDLTGCRLDDRRGLLERVIGRRDGRVRFSEAIAGRGEQLLDRACRLGVEGLISKRSDSVYHQRRDPSWVKSKCLQRQEFVVLGYTDPQRSRSAFGSLLLGYYDDGRLRYAGNVGTGFDEQSLSQIGSQVKRLEQAEAHFASLPRPARGIARTTHWIKPVLVAEVEFTQWTRDGRLRHPSFKGLREDKDPRQIGRERAAAGERVEAAAEQEVTTVKSRKGGRRGVTAGGEVMGIRITHPERIVYEDAGITKLQVAEYFAKIAHRMLPHVQGRPLSVVRCPGGIGSECFYQKHFAIDLGPGLREVKIRESKGVRKYSVVESAEGLVWLVQNNVLEIHTWGCRDDDVEKPDRVVFDLDPGEGAAWEQLVEAAKTVRKHLAAQGLKPLVKTTGGKGLHVVAMIRRGISWDELKDRCRGIAQTMAQDEPEKYVSKMTKSIRGGKVFVDYLRNGRGATAIAMYSTRARPGAHVSTPLSWAQLSRAKEMPVRTVDDGAKLARGRDPWAGIGRSAAKFTGEPGAE